MRRKIELPAQFADICVGEAVVIGEDRIGTVVGVSATQFRVHSTVFGGAFYKQNGYKVGRGTPVTRMATPQDIDEWNRKQEILKAEREQRGRDTAEREAKISSLRVDLPEWLGYVDITDSIVNERGRYDINITGLSEESVRRVMDALRNESKKAAA